MKGIGKMLCAVLAIMIVFTTSELIPDVASANASAGGKLDDAVVLYIGSPTAFVNNSETKIDSQNPKVFPVLKENRTLVPVRFVAESFGLTVQWDAKTSTVTMSKGSRKIRMTLGSTVMQVGNNQVRLEVPAESINDWTFIPLRALVEALDKKVFYDRGLIVISDDGNKFNADSDKSELDKIISRVNKPPVIGTKEALKSILESSFGTSAGSIFAEDEVRIFNNSDVMKKESVQAAPAAESAKADSGTAAGGDYSKTNVQVEGVDEADVVKTDGEYIYQVNKQKIVIAKAYPAENLELVGTIGFEGQSLNPREIYVDSKHLIVIGSSHGEFSIQSKSGDVSTQVYPPPFGVSSTKAVIYDIADKKNIKKLREVELEGGYVSSRKIGSSLYLVSNKNIGYRIMRTEDVKNSVMQEGVSEADAQRYADALLAPSYRDTAESSAFRQVDYSKMCYFPDSVQPNFMTVAAINLDKQGQKAEVATYLGAGENIYASGQNLYIAMTKYNYDIQTGTEKKKIMRPVSTEIKTLVYKFSLTGDSVTYLTKGEVPGTVLNQFSMDENGKFFRIATTRYAPWRSDMASSENNVYVLDEMLNITGRLENLAPGERIYSVRFMGDRGYVVTFKNVDPLFVIDLKDPAKPSVLGALKIPGYSDYLHPYDDKHIIGFGKDTVEVKGSAFYLGMKMAIFDVSDVANPKEKFTEKIGDRGTESELLRNHKALLFSKEKNLLSFPVTLMEVKNSSEKYKDGFPQYGQFTFQGAYVYNIDLDKGFTQKGRITHISAEEYAKAGDYWYRSDKNVERILYIGDNLYTLSQGMIKANRISDLKGIKELEIN